MRGSMATVSRNSRKAFPQNEATATARPHPAPYYGWNARGNLASMDPREAIQMDNLFPGVENVGIRKGCINWATACPEDIHSLMPYSGLTVNTLFAATNVGIYNVTANAAIGAAAVACTNGFWISLNITTAGGNYLFAVNGIDSAKLYNGTVWTVPVITVATSSTWRYCTVHKKRIWAVQKNTMSLWYLPVESVAGAATLFPVGALFKKGGYVVAIEPWTIDGGSGVDDLLVIYTSNGEIAVYQGTDPASSATWALVGVYDIAKPLGTRPLLSYGGDLLLLTISGLIPMSKLIQSSIVDRSAQISYNIDGAFNDAAVDYGINLGWQMITHRAANLLMVNVPVSQDSVSYQFAMNTITKKWCRFTGWNAKCWAELNNEIYFAMARKVSKAWIGTNDADVPISVTVLQAYAPIGGLGQKSISLARPNFGIAGSAQISLSLDADFKTFNGETIFTYAPASSGGVWDVSLWDTALWEGTSSAFEPKWMTVPNDLGYLHSFRLSLTTSSGNFIWTSTDFAVRGAGIL